MDKYNESPDDLSLLVEYTEYPGKYYDTIEKLNEIEMNNAGLKHFLEVTVRINQTLIYTASLKCSLSLK